jgi:chromate transporter
MNIFVLYLLLLKAVITSFSGLGSLPVIRQDLVVTHRALTDNQLNAAVAVGRTTPGPAGLYVVSVGYFAAGIPGAIAGWLALVTPSLSVIMMIRYLGRRAKHPRVKGVLQAIVLASAGMLLATALPLAREALSGVLLSLIALGSVLILVFTRLHSLWVILASAVVCLVADAVRAIFLL